MKTVTQPLLCATGTGASMVSTALMTTGKMPPLDHAPINHRHGHVETVTTGRDSYDTAVRA